MRWQITWLLLLALLVQYALSIDPNNPNELVKCFPRSSCDHTPIKGPNGEIYVRAEDCCNYLGKTLLTQPGGEAGNRCIPCLSVSFKNSQVTIAGHSTKHIIAVQLKATRPSQLPSLLLGLEIIETNRNRPLTGILDLENYPLPTAVSFTKTDTVKNITLKIKDSENSIALEENANYILRLNLVFQPVLTAFHFHHRELHLSIVDPDVVAISFSQELYTFSENVGTASLQILQSGTTADLFFAIITCERLFDSRKVIFPASNSTTTNITISFNIPNNSIAFEGSVSDTLKIESVSDARVSIKAPSTSIVQVIDDDVLYAGFLQSSYQFFESDGTVTIKVGLSASIGQVLRLRVFGGPVRQSNTIVTSGTTIDEVIVFFPSSDIVASVTFSIIDDNVGLETLEAYPLSLSIIGTSDGIILGNPARSYYSTTIISITDDENVVVKMQQSAIDVNESTGLIDVCAVLSNSVMRDISLSFSTTPGTAKDPNDYIGGLQRKIFSDHTSTCATYSIQQDNDIEGDESFTVDISNLQPSNLVKLHLGRQTSTTVTIKDSSVKPIEPTCNEEIDVLFILDSSGSVGFNNYTIMTSFASVVADQFEFGLGRAQFGAVTFASLASLDIPLGTHSDPSSFRQSIMSIPYKATKTNTAQALQIGRTELTTNGRSGVPHVIILLTDGQSDEPEATMQEALLAHSQGIRILAIGIGPKINLTELNGVATDPDIGHVFLISSFSGKEFSRILAPIVRETCEVAIGFFMPKYQVNEGSRFVEVSFGVQNGTLNREITVHFSFVSGTAKENNDFTGTRQNYILSPSSTKISLKFNIIDDLLPEEQEFFTASISTSDEFVKIIVPTTRIFINDDDVKTCKDKIDLIAVIDSSGSISPDDFETIKEFVLKVTNGFQIGRNRARFGVITFSNNARVNINLGEINAAFEFRKAVNQIPFEPGLTNTAAAIELARQQFRQNGRQEAPHVLLVVTDGRSNDRDATLQAAANTRAHDIEIFMIGVGSNVDTDELNAVASDPDSKHVFLLGDFSFGSLLKPLAKTICEPICQRQIDFMLVIDSSSSIGNNNFNILKQFLNDLVERYEVGANSAHFGAIRYSTSAAVVVTLGSIKSLNALQTALSSIPYISGSTNTAKGIQLAKQQFIINGRSEVPQVMIILTDGESDDSEATSTAASQSRQSGVEIFVVGIGNNVNDDELRDIATDTSGTHVYRVTEFKVLSFDAILSDLNRETCHVPICLVPPLDIVFALDSSSSVGSGNFITLLNFIVDVISQYNIEKRSGTQVGVVTFSTTARTAVSLVQFQTRASLSNAIINIPFSGDGTNTHLAIQHVRSEFNNNGRDNAKSVLVMVTDGRSNNPVATVTQAQLAHEENIEIFSIGIGSRTNQEELQDIASDPKSSHVFTINNYTANSFVTILQSLTKGICRKRLKCSHEAEVVFVIDSSSIVGPANFENLKLFLIGIISDINISLTKTRIAVIQYSTDANLIIRLNDHSDAASLINALSSLNYVPGTTNTASALNLAQLEIRNEGRVGVASIVYVFTGSESNDLDVTLTVAKGARKDGVTIASIGISSNVNVDEVRGIASNDNLVFFVNNYQLSSLNTIRENIVISVCNQEPHCRLDIVFLLDSSSTISSVNFKSQLEFIIRIVNQYEISASSTQVGIISFSSTTSATNPFGFSIGSILDKNQLVQAISSLQQFSDIGRRTDLALSHAYQDLQSFRSDVANVVVVITIGISNNPQTTTEAAQRLHSLEDTEVFTVAISTDTSDEFLNEIYAIATDPDFDHGFVLNDFQRQSFDAIYGSLIAEICDDDSNIRADPMFTVPLSGHINMPSLCYEVYGMADKYFNILSDQCVSVNAHYSEVKKVGHGATRPLHIIDEIAIRAVDNITSQCIDVVIELNNHQCLVSVNGALLRHGHFSKGDMHISYSLTRAVVSISNCENGKIVFAVQYKRLPTNFLELEIENGQGITLSSHGLVGQFWNAPVHITNEGIKLRQRHNMEVDNFYVITFTQSDGNVRKVPAKLQSRTWSSSQVSPCLYAGDSEGGHLFEVEEPNDSLLEGSYQDYVMATMFSTNYKYSKFISDC